MNKLPIWDILTGITLLGFACLVFALGAIVLNPTPLIPLPVEPTYTQVVIIIPTSTATSRMRALPPTWTPTPENSSTPEEIAAPGEPTRTLRPTSTIEPTNTPYIAPTPTPFPTNTPLPSATSANANCYVIAETPADNAEFRPNQEFDKRWTIKNNSGKTWQSNASDVRFKDGTKMQTGRDFYDLPRDIPQGGSFDITVRMRAPSSNGTYTGNWEISGDDGSLCRFYIKIVVR